MGALHTDILVVVLIISNQIPQSKGQTFTKQFPYNIQLTHTSNLADWVFTNHIHGRSVRIKFFTSASATSPFQDVDNWMRHFGISYALVPEKVRSHRIGKPVISVLVLGDRRHYTPLGVAKWIKLYSNRRWDHFIFVGVKAALSELWKEPMINRQAWKWGYATDSAEYVSAIEGDPYNPRFTQDICQISTKWVGIGRNIRGRHLLLAGWPHVPPYHYIKNEKESREIVHDGTHVRIFEESTSMFNYTFEIHSIHAESYGRQLGNGTWTGMVGDVFYEEKNLEACIYLGPQFAWYSMFDFAGFLSGAGILFLTAKPKPDLDWKAFLHPFKPSLWASLNLAFVIVIIAMYACLKFANFSTSGNRNYSAAGAVLLSFRVAMEQPARIPSSHVKIIAGAWLISVIITGTAYKSQVVSSLTLPVLEKLPNSFETLAEHTDYTPILNNIGGLEVIYFESSEPQFVRKIASRIQFEPLPIDCITKAVVNPKTVCMGWCPFLEYTVAERASPDSMLNPVYFATEPVMQVQLAVAFQKDSPYANGFTQIISTFYEAGIYKVWENDVLRIHKLKGTANYEADPGTTLNKKLKSIIDSMKGSKGIKSLKVSNLRMMFIVLTAGLTLGIVAFVFEKITEMVIKRKNAVMKFISSKNNARIVRNPDIDLNLF